ncbi:type IV toxin-antitoxin system AbiEi family antitoxin domain-containing protein [Streptomyces sp. LP05-1]|uniref:Type IV toxin-antitoxin system AbiEi family antitoxin domain-containing protein n=1 Tax=Streptomyces pyxinae TaxID=2970734 RepID=A0ABT2CE45_9ACTN|nr:WhiB family transcriptional regulator [Streptomyces sp. LP05-1]MCS0635026.1 type IV toxin-antitoxin system AbiEi family antitoxin domain-containing protein [Streptomyces sp. LP05-1]
MVTSVSPPLPASARSVAASVPVPCQRRPDVFQHPLMTNPPARSMDLPIQKQRLQALSHAARRLCSSCPLWAECLRDSVARADPGGFAAATTRQDRLRIRQYLGIGDARGELVALPAFRSDAVGPSAVVAAFEAVRERRQDPAGPPSEGPAAPLPLNGEGGTPGGHSDPGSPIDPGRSTGPADPTGPGRTRSPGGGPRTNPDPTDEVAEAAMAATADQRITFSLKDPALAIQRAVLGPLVRSVLPTLEITERLAGMLAPVAAAGAPPQLIDACRQSRRALEEWHAEAGEAADGTAPGPADGGLTGSVSVDLVTSDPLAALRQEIFDPLLRRLAETLERIGTIAELLLASPGEPVPHAPALAAVRDSVRDFASHFERYDILSPRGRSGSRISGLPGPDPRGRTGGAGASSRTVIPFAARPTPSLRRAVEAAVTTLPGPFTSRDVWLALPPGAYQDSGKSVSNALSALVKAGRLHRVSRGTYARVAAHSDSPADPPAGALPETAAAHS